MTLSEERDAQGGLEQTSHVDRVASLTGIRAVAAILVVGTHAAYATGKYTHGYWGLVGARMEIGVPIFFVLSGFLLFRPWVKSAATGGPPPSPCSSPTFCITSATRDPTPGTAGSDCSATSR
jgi:peptidoglycan/LPS O-acetylase OafA/YrhL